MCKLRGSSFCCTSRYLYSKFALQFPVLLQTSQIFICLAERLWNIRSGTAMFSQRMSIACCFACRLLKGFISVGQVHFIPYSCATVFLLNEFWRQPRSRCTFVGFILRLFMTVFIVPFIFRSLHFVVFSCILLSLHRLSTQMAPFVSFLWFLQQYRNQLQLQNFHLPTSIK